MQSHFPACPMRFLGLDSFRHICNANASQNIATMNRFNVFPFTCAGLPEFDCAIKIIGVWHADRTFCTVDFNSREVDLPNIKAHDEGCNCPLLKLCHSCDMRIYTYRNSLPTNTFMTGYALIISTSTHSCDSFNRTQEVYKRGQVVWPHIKHW